MHGETVNAENKTIQQEADVDQRPVVKTAAGARNEYIFERNVLNTFERTDHLQVIDTTEFGKKRGVKNSHGD